MTRNSPEAGAAASPWTLRTPRLVLHPLVASHLERLVDLFVLPEVRRYLWDDRVVPVTEIAELLGANERRFGQNRPGLWGVELAPVDDGSPTDVGLIGCTGFWSFFEPPVEELIFAFAPSQWGKGLAAEAAAAVMALAVDKLGKRVLRASTDRPNEASIRLLNRLGFEPDVVRQRQTDATEAGAQTLHYRWTVDS